MPDLAARLKHRWCKDSFGKCLCAAGRPDANESCRHFTRQAQATVEEVFLATDIDSLRARVTLLENTLAGANATVPVELRCGTIQTKALAMLMAHRIVTRDMFMLALYGDHPEGRNENIARVIVFKLRERLRPRGISVRTKPLQGWYIDDADKAKIGAMNA